MIGALKTGDVAAAHTIPQDYVERVYAGWVGKAIGVRHGGNVEGWTYERIQEVFGEITHYVHHFKNFAADDDTNGPMFFLRALEDVTHTRDITPADIGDTWLNYAGDGHGFYWWGGYGKSTEHTAYLNMKNGIPAPDSGSIRRNGAAVAEQIGGQIFIDVWGLIAPGNPALAAEYAAKAASVSHDGNGVYGGQFIAACIAAAFTAKSVSDIIEAGLSVIPDDCEYARMTRNVVAYYREHPENWRDCFAYVKGNFGYDRYPGACHIIPNAAVIVLSLLYGEGDFARTINICNMCGWDTDCNVGNAGTILGVFVGIDGIDDSWRRPINDFLCCSSAVGTLNMLTLPWCAAYIASFGYKIAERQPPERWASILAGTAPRFHFEFPGSTHAFRTDAEPVGSGTSFVEGSDEQAASGTRSLKAVFDRAIAGKGHRVYYKTYYRPSDFNDSRYDPSFSPQLYPGQTAEAQIFVPSFVRGDVLARLYAKDGNGDVRHYGEKTTIAKDAWQKLTYRIPAMSGSCLEEVGVELIPAENGPLVCYIDDFDFGGVPEYEVLFEKERLEQWNALHIEVSQCTYLRGIWTLEDGELSGSYYGEPAECYTGDLAWRDYRFEAEVIPKVGPSHHIMFRVQGGIRSYAAGFAEGGRFALYKNAKGYAELASVPFDWAPEQTYRIAVEAVGDTFRFFVDGRAVLTHRDAENPYLHGQIGFSNMGGSHTHYRSFRVNGY